MIEILQILLPPLPGASPDDLFLLDIDDAGGGLLRDKLLKFFEFHRDPEEIGHVDGLDKGDGVVFAILAPSSDFHFRIPRLGKVHIGVVGFVELRQYVGKLRIGIDDRRDTQVLARFLSPDIVLVRIELLGKVFDDIRDFFFGHRAQVTLEEPLGENLDEIVRPIHIAQSERMHRGGRLHKLHKDIGKLLVALHAEFVFREVEITHHLLDRNRNASFGILGIGGIEKVGGRGIDR